MPKASVRKTIKWGVLSVLGLMLACLCVLTWVIGTQSGTAWAWHISQKYIPEVLTIEQVEGRLAGPLQLDNLQLNLASFKLGIKKIELNWQPKKILTGTLQVENINVSGLDFYSKPTKSSKKTPKSGANKPIKPPHLPLKIRLASFKLSDTKIHLDNDQYKIQRFLVEDLALDNATWQVKNIALDMPQATAQGQVKIKPKAHFPTQAKLHVKLNLPDYAPLVTDIQATGSLKKLNISQKTQAPYNIHAELIVRDLVDQAQLHGHIHIEPTALKAINSDLPAYQISGDISPSGSLNEIKAQILLNAIDPNKNKITGQGQVGFKDQVLAIKTLQLSAPKNDMQLTAQGDLSLADKQKLNLDIHWHNLHWPLDESVQYSSPKGAVTVSGSLDAYQLKGGFFWHVKPHYQGRFTIAGQGDLQSFQLTKLRTEGDLGQITASGHIAWAPYLSVQTQIDGQQINPGVFVPSMPGNLKLTAHLEADKKQTLKAELKKLELTGQLRQQPVKLKLELSISEQVLKLKTLDANLGQNHLQAQGRLGWQDTAPVHLSWQMDAPRLSQLADPLAGAIKGQGEITGHFKRPIVTIKLAAHDFKYAQISVKSAQLKSFIDSSDQQKSQVNLTGKDLETGQQNIKNLELDATGKLSQHKINARAQGDFGQAKIALAGQLALAKKQWDFELNELRGNYQNLQPWQLSKTSKGQVSPSVVRLSSTCLHSGPAKLCLKAHANDKEKKVHIELSDLAFSYFEPLLPSQVILDGQFDAQVDAQQKAGQPPLIQAKLQTSAGGLFSDQNGEQKQQVLHFKPGVFNFNFTQNNFDFTVNWPLEKKGHLKAQLASHGKGALKKHPIDGHLDLQVGDLSFLSKLVAEIARIDGHFGGDMQISGTLEKPKVQGQLALRADPIELITPGLSLTNVKLDARGQGDYIQLQMQANSDAGELAIQGRANTDPARMKLNINGDHFQVVNTPDIRAWVSPKLTVTIDRNAVHADGELAIPKARITPKKLPESGVATESSDVVYVDEKDQQTRVGRAIYADILATLGDVKIDAFGLKTGIEGDLKIHQQPHKPATGSGKLTLKDGSYRAYGQNLDIQQGQIYFANTPLDNPGLDLKAARYPARDIEVGVNVRGTAKKPQISLYSDPQMAEDEILSWLLLGQPLNQNTGSENNQVAKVAIALGLSRGIDALDRFSNKIKDTLDLDEVGFGSQAGYDNSEAAFTLGKYLTPKLYFSYGIGLFNASSALTLRYLISAHWQLQSVSTGTDTGGDIIYTIDR